MRQHLRKVNWTHEKAAPYNVRRLVFLDMRPTFEEAIADWREADLEARAAEILLKKALDDFTAARRGPAVHDVLVQEVAKARSKANDCLTVALAMIQVQER